MVNIGDIVTMPRGCGSYHINGSYAGHLCTGSIVLILAIFSFHSYDRYIALFDQHVITFDVWKEDINAFGSIFCEVDE